MKYKLLTPPKIIEEKLNFLLGGKFMSENVVYEPTIFPEENVNLKIYTGIPVGNWKQRLYNHRHSFKNKSVKNQTTLCKHYWDINDKGLTPHLEWWFISKPRIPKNFRDRCELCIQEIKFIIKYKNPK